MLIAVAGKKQHGKNSIGSYLLKELDYRTIAFADPLKFAAMDIWGLTYNQCYGTEAEKETVDPRWGLTPRFILQRFGTEVARAVHPDTWARKCLETIRAAREGRTVRLHLEEDRSIRNVSVNPSTNWVITDCRFLNEAKIVRENRGHVIKVLRPTLDRRVDDHQSEVEVDKIQPDITIPNDDTLEVLHGRVDEALRVLGLGRYWDKEASEINQRTKET